MNRNHRILALLLSVLMLFTSIKFAAFWIPATAADQTGASDQEIIIRDDALHFIIRHWHTDFDSEATQQQESAQRDGEDWFVIVEGYIIPLREGDEGYGPDGEGNERNFRIVLVNQENGELVLASEQTSPYIQAFDVEDGTLTLAIKPRREANPLYKSDSSVPQYINLERFCGVSLSAGRGAVEYDKDGEGNTTGIIIEYKDGNTHLVKGHVFYNSWNRTVRGTDDKAVFDPNDLEIDTASIYTWADNYSDHQKGDIITYHKGADVLSACWTDEDLEAAAEELNTIDGLTNEEFKKKYFSSKPEKFYSTLEGMHTNKTLVEEGESGRLFLADLEAWYIEGQAANVAFVLDASGSMAFVSDAPNKVNVYYAVAKRVGIDITVSNDVYSYSYKSKATGKDPLSIVAPNDAANNYAALGEFIQSLAENEAILDEFLDAISDKTGRRFTKDAWDTLFGLIGKVNETNVEESAEKYAYPQHDKLIGYYEIQDNKPSSGNDRTWFYNSIDATKVKKYRDPSVYEYNSKNPADFSSVVRYHEEGDTFRFDDSLPIINCDDYGVGTWGAFPINFNNVFSASNHRTYGMNLRKASAGYMPNAVPSGNSFTISFTLENTWDTDASFNDPIEVLYVGAASGVKSAGGYFRVTREGGDLVFYNGHVKQLYALKGVFGTLNDPVTDRQRFTFVFNGDDVAIYLGNAYKKSVQVDGLSGGKTIVFAPFNDNEYPTGDTDPLCYLDDIFVYDIDLTDGEVSQFIAAYNDGYKDGKASNIDDFSTVSAWDQVFILDPTVLSVLLNPNNTAHTPLGVAAYNYFVYDANDPIDFSDTGIATKEFAPLAYWDGVQLQTVNNAPIAMAGGNRLGELTQATKKEAGWYYLTHAGEKAPLESYGTAKRLVGLDGEKTKAIIDGKVDTVNYVRDCADAPGFRRGGTEDGTGKEYKPGTDGWNTATRFYLDEKGNLRCFFSRGSQVAACSYVYELEDNQYVKTEALQRVLANFSSKLSERSPSSLISAVKFSMKPGNLGSAREDLEKLVLLDWTSNTEEIAGIMSQKRGDGSATDFEVSTRPDGTTIKQYNYSLTGGTYAETGLNAFMTLLAKDDRLDDEAPKFLILFTDGVLEGDNTKKYAEDLKELGYTIITVYLPCGPAVDSNGDLDITNKAYLDAQAKLTELASVRDDNEPYFFASTDVTTLTRIFEEEILSRITDVLEDYTVQDYIDPRFDLMEETVDGNIVWHLNADGKVEKRWENGKLIDVIENVNAKDYTIHLTREATPTARDPYLRYDKKNDMYYLEWVGQTIPSTPVGAKNLLPVWNAKFLLRAKDDFIGGNAVLTNGNAEKMNWVFHPLDTGVPADRKAYEERLHARFEEEFDGFTLKQMFDYAKEHALELTGMYAVDLTGKTRWADLSQEEQNKVKAFYVDKSVTEKLNLKVTENDASSGTDDMFKRYGEKDGKRDYEHPLDEYPSKGFPRTTANVRLLPIVTKPVDSVMYLGEAVSPRQMLLEIEDEYITKSYYLDYLKRYAYQRSNGTNDTPLLELLSLWLDVANDEVVEKEFSLPYMYLPDYEYDADSGKFTSDRQLNNTGGKDTHEKDVVGILTYRWVRFSPPPDADDYESAIKDYVKDNTDEVTFSLTVEFTPLCVDDTLSGLNSLLDDGTRRDTIFAPYVPLNDPNASKKEFKEEEYLFDRIKYVNGDSANPGSYMLITEDCYKWNREYKPEAAEQQTIYDEDHDKDKRPEEDGIYGNATFLNNGRTLTAYSLYTKEVVSGGVALELRMMIGELKEALEAGVFNQTFELTAKRTFVDTEYIESIKRQAQMMRAGNVWEDYGIEFTFTFKFDIDEDTLKELAKTADKNGYVSIYTKTEKIKTTFGGGEKTIYELPIGTYAFDLKEVNAAVEKLFEDNKLLHFATAGYDTKAENFKTDYFHNFVLNGLNTTTNEGGANGGPTWAEGKNTQEIDENNIGGYIAEAGMGTEKVYFYVGTEPNPEPNDPTYDYVPKRGTEDSDEKEYYIQDRLCMLQLSTGTVRLTIRERGAESSSEKFIYHITGYTLGAEFLDENRKDTVDLYVSVSGNGETTIELLPGHYVIEELPEWAWKYKNEETWGGKRESAGDTENIPEEWVISSDWLTAKTDLRYRDDDPVEEHKTVTYEHVRNDKTWLGKEGSTDNKYDPVHPAGSEETEDEELTEPTEP